MVNSSDNKSGASNQEMLSPVSGSMPLLGYSTRALYWGVWGMLGLFMATQDMIRSAAPLTLGAVFQFLYLNLGQNLIWGLISLGTLWIVRRYPLHSHPPLRNWLTHLVASSVIVPAGLLIVWTLATLLDASSGFALDDFIGFLFWFFCFHHLVCYWGVVGIHEGLILLRGYRESEIRLSRMESELAAAELQSLKTQLNPHFMFNALNTVSTMIFSSPQQADRMLMKLSQFLRLSLDQEHEPFKPLRSEIHLIEEYIEIERVRFGDQISLCTHVPTGLEEALVPAFILQPLVENAIKHGIQNRPSGGKITVRASHQQDMLVLEIQDDGFGNQSTMRPAVGFGLGLDNTRQRLRQHFGTRHGFELVFPSTGGAISRLSFPLRLPQHASIHEPWPDSLEPKLTGGPS